MKNLSIVIFLFLCACSGNEDRIVQPSKPQTKDKTAETQTRKPEKTTQSKTQSAYSFKLIGNSGNFGYQILDATGKMVINQPNIPAIQGIKGFLSESDARKAANLSFRK